MSSPPIGSTAARGCTMASRRSDGPASVSSAETILGQSGPGGVPAGYVCWRRRHLLCLHRLRLCLDPRRGSKKPQRDVPIGIIASLAYMHGALHSRHRRSLPVWCLSTRSASRLRSPTRFAQVGLPWAQLLISVGAVAGMTSVLLVLMLSQPRVMLAMARDGLVPQALLRSRARAVSHPVEIDHSHGASWLGDGRADPSAGFWPN